MSETNTQRLENLMKPRPTDPVRRYPRRLGNVWDNPMPPKPQFAQAAGQPTEGGSK